MALDGILFDFDGTLCDTIPLIVESYQYTYKKHGKRHYTPEEIIAGIGLPLEHIFGLDYPDEVDLLLETYLDYNNQYTTTKYGIFLGVTPMLQGLQELGVPMGIVTAKRFSNAKATLDHSGLAPYFSTIVAKDDTDKHKPDPTPLMLGMKKLGFSKPERILYVGDALFDVQAAQNGDFLSAIVGWSQADHQLLREQEPDYWIEEAQDLISLAKSLYQPS